MADTRDTQKLGQNIFMAPPLVGYSITHKLLLGNDFRWDMSQMKPWFLSFLVAVIKLAFIFLINLK